jgi:hypothetical protein
MSAGWVAVDADGVGADAVGRAGQWIEPSLVSLHKPCRTNGADRVRQNRVVPAVVATAKPCGDAARPTGQTASVNPWGDGGKQEFVTEESAA